jgi:hypothetical protein
MSRLALLAAAALLSLPARAQAPADAPVPPPSAPPAQGAPEGLQVTVTDDDQVLLRSRPVSPRQLFEALGREDLVAQADANAARRRALIIAGTAVAVAGVTAGLLVFAAGPDFSKLPCNTDDPRVFQACQDDHRAHTIAGTVPLFASLAVGGLLVTLGILTLPDVFTPYELHKFIRQHNASLDPPKATFRLAPWLSPGGGGLAGAGTF